MSFNFFHEKQAPTGIDVFQVLNWKVSLAKKHFCRNECFPPCLVLDKAPPLPSHNVWERSREVAPCLLPAPRDLILGNRSGGCRGLSAVPLFCWEELSPETLSPCSFLPRPGSPVWEGDRGFALLLKSPLQQVWEEMKATHYAVPRLESPRSGKDTENRGEGTASGSRFPAVNISQKFPLLKMNACSRPWEQSYARQSNSFTRRSSRVSLSEFIVPYTYWSLLIP